MKKFSLLLLVCALLVAAGIALADDRGDGQNTVVPEDREHLRIDHELLKTMTWEEQRAYMRAWKEARAEDARLRGETPSTEGGYRPLAEPRRVAEPENRLVAGTNVTYDSGTVTGTAGIASQMVGNRYDTARHHVNGVCCEPVEASGSVTQVTFDMVVTFFGSAVFSIYDNISGTMAPQVTSMAFAGIMTGLNTVAVGGGGTMNTYSGGSFLAGIWQFDPTMTGLGVDTGTTGSQGFHAISLNDGANGSMLTTLMSLNAVFRVTGNVATPVELQSFTIED